MPWVLLADDNSDVRNALRILLKSEGFQSRPANSPAQALKLAGDYLFDAALIDLNYARDTTSGREGMDLLAQLKALDESLPVLVMTAWSNVDLAVEAMRAGARDFIQKPWDNDRLIHALRTQVELARATRENRRLREAALRTSSQAQPLLGDSPAMKQTRAALAKAAASDASVLLLGENGAGKGLAAQALHAGSARAGAPLVTVNLGGIPATLFEGELFGHVAGAFTGADKDRIGRFEMADGGTLVLDEVGNLPPTQQPKLLRALESGEFERLGSGQTRRADVRVIAATNSDIHAEARKGRFRQDLLYRLNTVEVTLPPLRDRREDIPLLAAAFLRELAGKYGRPAAGFSSGALERLTRFPWPGNVRELHHVVERAVLMAEAEVIREDDLGLGNAASHPTRWPEGMTLMEAEKWLMENALRQTGGKAGEAARQLGLSRSAFYRKLEKHGLNSPE